MSTCHGCSSIGVDINLQGLCAECVAPDPLRHIKVFNAAYNNEPVPDVPYAVWRQGWGAVAKWKAENAAPAPDPTATECPRCKNDIRRCDCNMGASAPDADTVDQIVTLADKHAAVAVMKVLERDGKTHDTDESRAALRAAVERVAKDAQRYRWLRDQSWKHDSWSVKYCVIAKRGDGLDAAIDTAMEQK